MKSLRMLCSATLVALFLSSTLCAQKKDKTEDGMTVYPIAIFPFAERGRDASELGNKATDLLFANLVVNPDMYLVEREEIDKLFTEQELNRSGLINPEQATQIGYLTGAKILVTGSVLVVGDKLYVVAKMTTSTVSLQNWQRTWRQQSLNAQAISSLSQLPRKTGWRHWSSRWAKVSGRRSGSRFPNVISDSQLTTQPPKPR